MSRENPIRSFYFGCYRDLGHYHWEPGPYKVYFDHSGSRPKPGTERPVPHPWGWKIDGGLCPYVAKGGKQYMVDGVAALHHKDGWTALAFWDRSVDSRPKSNSAFVFEAELDYDAALALARETFPEVFARLAFEVRAEADHNEEGAR